MSEESKATKTAWDYFLEEQQALAQASLSDPHNRFLAGVAILGGVVSSMALARLYTKLTPDASDDHFYAVLPKAVFAVGTGLVGVVWYMNKAHAERKAVEALAAASELEGEIEAAEADDLLTREEAEGLAGALESGLFDVIQQIT